MIVAIYSNIAIFVQVFVGSVGYSIYVYTVYCDIPTNKSLAKSTWSKAQLAQKPKSTCAKNLVPCIVHR